MCAKVSEGADTGGQRCGCAALVVSVTTVSGGPAPIA